MGRGSHQLSKETSPCIFFPSVSMQALVEWIDVRTHTLWTKASKVEYLILMSCYRSETARNTAWEKTVDPYAP